MLSAIKLFFGTSKGRGLVLAVAIALTLVATYSLGHANGSTAGYTAGQKSRDAEVADLKAKVQTLTDKVNEKTRAENAKADRIQSQAADAAIQTQKQLTRQLRERDAIIQRYQAQTPTVIREACGLSIETVRVINQLIDNANNEKNQSHDGSPGDTDAAAAQPTTDTGATQ